MNIGLIGDGAIAGYVRQALTAQGHMVGACLVRPEKAGAQGAGYFGTVEDLPRDIEMMIDCAGHSALTQYAPDLLRSGVNMITVSLGALADDALLQTLEQAARTGGARLHLASGAIGALDCLQAARIGGLDTVTYVGRKPPQGWRGSRAEDILDLDAPAADAQTHFDGSAREAALAYPKNANVAAAVALAGLGFDRTRARLVADPQATRNIHEITASGAFGECHFTISGASLPDNPRSSALAAMSVLSKLAQTTAPVSL